MHGFTSSIKLTWQHNVTVTDWAEIIKSLKSAIASSSLHKLDALTMIEAKVSRCFDEMVAIVFCGSWPWRSDYKRARRRALAIAKPTSEGYWPRRSTINLTTRVCFLRANEEQARNWDCNLDIANIRWNLYWSRWGSVTPLFGRWTQTKYAKL